MGITAAIITVRMTSSRMPGKSMADVAGKPSLWHILTRMKSSAALDEVIVATTVNQADQPIVDLCGRMGVKVFRGSENDVLGRILGAAEAHDVDTILYICGDCTCADPALAGELIGFFRSGGYDYASNCGEITYPLGQNLEVFSRAALRRVDSMTQNPWDREHVTEYFYTHPDIFKCGFVTAPRELERPHYRLCIDVPEDQRMMNALFEGVYHEGEVFTTRDIVRYLDAHQEIVKINQALKYKKYRASVIGLGRAGLTYDLDITDGRIRSHAGAFMKLSRTKMDSAADPSEAARERFRGAYHIDDVYEDAGRMLAERQPEIVSVAGPTATHAGAIEQALACPSVRAILCEKPLTDDVARSETIVKKCRERGVSLTVNYWMRFSPLYRNLKAFLDGGGLGRLETAVYLYSKGLLNSGSHAVDLLHYLFGAPEWVQAGAAYDIGTGDDNVEGMVRFANGVTVHLGCCDWRGHFTADLMIYGAQGMIRIEENGYRIGYFRAGESARFPGIRELLPVETPPFDTALGQPMTGAVEEIVAVLDGVIPETSSTGESALMADRVVAALKTSSRGTGARVMLGR